MKCQRKDLKKRAPGKQPICGLWAAARCCGIKLDNAAKTQEFRAMLLSNNVISRGGNWVGGTTDEERKRICEFLGFTVSDIFREVLHKRGSDKTITVKTLLSSPAFFRTNAQYMLHVDQHVLYVRTNKMKRKLWIADQRGKPMRIARKNKEGPDKELSNMLYKHVISVWAIERKN